MRTFIIPKDPYDESILFPKTSIDIEPGLTVLVGCNGIGKTTLLDLMKQTLENLRIPVFDYDNLRDGGNNAMDWALNISNNISLLATLATSSEGERIYINFGEACRKLWTFIKQNANAKEKWILIDSIDSGLSIDNIDELKEFLKDVVIKENGDNIYVIVSSNSYEFCRGENCFDIHNGRYIEFEDYDHYRDFILRSREWKDKRYTN